MGEIPLTHNGITHQCSGPQPQGSHVSVQTLEAESERDRRDSYAYIGAFSGHAQKDPNPRDFTGGK